MNYHPHYYFCFLEETENEKTAQKLQYFSNKIPKKQKRLQTTCSGGVVLYLLMDQIVL